jgi:threonylcarbamoyladenosine tRNA methylthiotransferase MtaB
MFANTLALVDEAGLTHLHVFPYSSRPGTPAARIPGLPGDVVKERAARLRAKGAEALATWLRGRIGGTASVLVESETSGQSEHYVPVRLDGAAEPGSILAARITGATATELLGTAST